MNDCYYIEYEAKVMFCDTAELDIITEVAHRRMFDVLCFSGEPIAYDDETLPTLGKVKPQDWARVRGNLERKGWKRTGDQWTHDGTMATINKAREKYQKRLAQTAGARAAKAVTTPVTSPVTENVPDDNQNQNQSNNQESESKSESSQESVCNKSSLGDSQGGDANIPTWQEVKEFAACNGVTFDNAKSFFDHHENNGLWLNQFNRLINWTRKVKTWQETNRVMKGQTPHQIGPSLRDVKLYATDKGEGATRYAVDWHRHWHAKNWERNGKLIDWQVEFSASWNKKRSEQ